MPMQDLQLGFTDPVHQAQQVFRAILGATARPGIVQTLNVLPQPAPALSSAATAVCLALADFETPLWLDAQALAARDYLVFHCGSPITADRERATFALIANAHALDNFSDFYPGSDEFPDTACTLIVEVGELVEGDGTVLRGPGIREQIQLRVGGVGDGFWQQVAANHRLFPRGVDLILTCGDRIAALPRSVCADSGA